MAVYTSDGSGGFTPVPGACVDDVPVQPIGRTLQAAVTFLVALAILFVLMRAAPGDPLLRLGGDRPISPREIAVLDELPKNSAGKVMKEVLKTKELVVT